METIAFWHKMMTSYFDVFLQTKLQLLEESIMLSIASSQSVVAPPLETTQLHESALPQPKGRRDFLDPVDEIVQSIYYELPSGFGIEEQDAKDALYGELTPLGVRQLIQIMFVKEQQHHHAAATSSSTAAPPPCVFVDFGSGTGKVALELSLLLRPPSTSVQCIGIELSRPRHSVAVEAAERCAGVAKSCGALPCIFYCGSFLDDPLLPTTDIHHQPTHVFCCGLGFDRATVEALCDRLMALCPATLRCCVLLLNHKPESTRLFCSWSCSVAHLSTTWSDAAPAFVLRRPTNSD